MKRYFKNLNLLVLAVLFILGFALLYFLYYRQRNQTEVYVRLSVTRGINIPINASFNWIPYWLDESISIGDKEVSPLGGVTAIVLDKESYEGAFYGRFVYLLLKVNAIKDRSGIYLFKNKPLSTGAGVDLKLSKAQISGLVTYIGFEKPKYEYNKLQVTLVGSDVDYWVADSLRVGSTIMNDKGVEIAKVIGKNIKPSTRSPLSFDPSKRNVDVTVDLMAKKIGDNYFYSEMQKVKVDENLFFPFKEGSINFPISTVNEINQTK